MQTAPNTLSMVPALFPSEFCFGGGEHSLECQPTCPNKVSLANFYSYEENSKSACPVTLKNHHRMIPFLGGRKGCHAEWEPPAPTCPKGDGDMADPHPNPDWAVLRSPAKSLTFGGLNEKPHRTLKGKKAKGPDGFATKCTGTVLVVQEEAAVRQSHALGGRLSGLQPEAFCSRAPNTQGSHGKAITWLEFGPQQKTVVAWLVENKKDPKKAKSKGLLVLGKWKGYPRPPTN